MSRNKLLKPAVEQTPLSRRREHEYTYTPFESAIVSATEKYVDSVEALLRDIESNLVAEFDRRAVYALTNRLKLVEIVSRKLIERLDPLSYRISQSRQLSLPPAEAIIGFPEFQEAKSVSQWLDLGAANAERHLNELVRSGVLLSIASFSTQSGLSEDKIKEALALDHLFVIPVDGTEYIPWFFLDAALKSAGIENVSKALAPLRGESRLEFFLTGKESLSGRAPLEALVSGDTAHVMRAAARFVRRM